MAKDFMIDLETMGTSAGDAIIAIGAVAMNLKDRKLGNTFYIQISLEDTQREGFRINAGTVLWWLKQSSSARGEFAENDLIGSDVRYAMRALTRFISQEADCPVDKIQVWGNGAAMDNVLLDATYRKLGLPKPWSYKGDMCYRTIKNITRDKVQDIEPEIAHHALYDAVAQAKTLFKRLDTLGL